MLFSCEVTSVTHYGGGVYVGAKIAGIAPDPGVAGEGARSPGRGSGARVRSQCCEHAIRQRYCFEPPFWIPKENVLAENRPRCDCNHATNSSISTKWVKEVPKSATKVL